VDPIDPIVSGALPIAGLPVEPLERISRERDRPSRDEHQRRRREPPPAFEPDDDADDDADDERPHIDVRV
jgi:hypothetical protein